MRSMGIVAFLKSMAARVLRRGKASVVLATILTAVAAEAQNFSIDWFTIDGGGGTSTGGAYALSGTIGQPDAGRMTGGNFTLQGGFWSFVSAVQNPDMPLLAVTNMAGAVKVFWPLTTGVTLQWAPAFTNAAGQAAWNPVGAAYQTNASEVYIMVSPPMGTRFYRLSR